MGEPLHSSVPLWACLVSLAAVIPICLLRRRPNLREGATFVAGFAKLGLVLSLVPPVLEGRAVEYTLCELVPGAPLQFRVDGLGLLFALVASSLWIATSLYSIGYMRGLKEHAQTRYYSFFAVSLSATIGVAFAANLLTLYLFYEMLSLATYPLVTHHQDREARTAGRTYLTYLLGASIGFALPAMVFCYMRSGGNLDFSLAGFLAGKVTGAEATVLLLLFVFGFAKAGIMPFHSWLPGAMVAPTPVSALLHAVAVVKVGVFCILRVVTGVFGVDLLADLDLGTIVSWIAGFTVIAASLIALTQDNLKRRLAFSTIGQLSCVVLGCALLTPAGTVGSMLHIAMHALGKITLFMCAGAIFVATGKKSVSEMTGIGRQMPVTMGAFFIGAVSVIGLPPTGGFVSKWHLITGAFEAGRHWVVAVFLASSLLNIAYLIPPVVRAFFAAPEPAGLRLSAEEAPEACLVPIVLTAAGCVLLFLFPETLIALARLMVAGGKDEG